MTYGLGRERHPLGYVGSHKPDCLKSFTGSSDITGQHVSTQSVLPKASTGPLGIYSLSWCLAAQAWEIMHGTVWVLKSGLCEGIYKVTSYQEPEKYKRYSWNRVGLLVLGSLKTPHNHMMTSALACGRHLKDTMFLHGLGCLKTSIEQSDPCRSGRETDPWGRLGPGDLVW